jgi:hypothetical protein
METQPKEQKKRVTKMNKFGKKIVTEKHILKVYTLSN